VTEEKYGKLKKKNYIYVYINKKKKIYVNETLTPNMSWPPWEPGGGDAPLKNPTIKEKK